jgi:sugar phosphate isomerase/epimerase
MTQFGFVTNCLGEIDIHEAARIAASLGYDCLEVGPRVKRDRAAYRDVQQNGPVRIQSFIYGRNFLSRDPAERDTFRAELLRLLDLAADLSVGQITTSTGVDPRLNLEDNIAAALEYWIPLFEQAAQGGIRIALEFCPTSGNFALGPYAWRRLLAATEPWPNFGLNYDPSHLLWQFIDPYRPLAEFGPHIFSVHAKDTVIWHDRLVEHGILTPYAHTERMAHGTQEARAIWWEYGLPGDGDLDWPQFLRALYATGFDGAICVEHEAPEYMASREAVVQGLRRSLQYLHTVDEAVRGSKS